MLSDADNYVSTCGPCSRNKRHQSHVLGEMLKYHTGAPTVHLGFLPHTARGNEYVLVMVDQFTKWVECIPLPSQTAEVTATSAVNELRNVSIGIYLCGCPVTERSSGALSPRGRKLRSPRLRLGVSLRLPCQTPLCPPRPREPL